ncbi:MULTISPECIES: hypothetical protein [unclassified Mycolicibacterium]|nr:MULTISPECIES: hypothetical protein [unclassified Mycolicibacterium]MUL87560.1 hypothetical protein [Mycolicibacterium sp. CBMA 331]MUM37857.1 hypothetical protein [Mycolicibacterium sp. CBMA 247]MUL81794.1 hypothetical protein [Mycolicibacterium sp. CBMA 329]MUL99576.1 hypothetical protein [Mycolicibacterium sp. CBMA 334]MUM26674.1 hypothetical protein [Mycolicibacterium sp. CBMA 295]
MLRERGVSAFRLAVKWVGAFFSQGPSRKVLRRRLILFSILPAVVLVAIAVKLVTMVVYGYSAGSHYLSYDSYGLADDVRMLKSLNVIDSYKPYFADGDRYVLEGKLADAESEFKKSLSLVSQERSCPVRINLEVVLEALGDLRNADKHRDEAKPFWTEALKLTQEAPGGCFDTKTEPDEERRKHLNETEQRLQEKLKDPPPAQGGGGGEQGSGDQGGGGGGEQGGQGGGGQGGGDQGQGAGQGGDAPGQGGQGGQDSADQAAGQGDQGGADQGGAGQSGQGSGGAPDKSTPDTVGADRIATESGGVATHQLNPGQGDPGDVLKRLLEDSNASGTERE